MCLTQQQSQAMKHWIINATSTRIHQNAVTFLGTVILVQVTFVQATLVQVAFCPSDFSPSSLLSK